MVGTEHGPGERRGGVGGGDAGHDVDRHRGIRGVGLGGLEDGSGHPEDAGVTTGDDGDP